MIGQEAIKFVEENAQAKVLVIIPTLTERTQALRSIHRAARNSFLCDGFDLDRNGARLRVDKGTGVFVAAMRSPRDIERIMGFCADNFLIMLVGSERMSIETRDTIKDVVCAYGPDVQLQEYNTV